ncbi:unnamed protein product, partial [Sphagnum compactum]
RNSLAENLCFQQMVASVAIQIPVRLQCKTTSNKEQTERDSELKRAVFMHAQQNQRSLPNVLVSGTPGTGKTTLVDALVRENVECEIMNVLIEEARDAFENVLLLPSNTDTDTEQNKLRVLSILK